MTIWHKGNCLEAKISILSLAACHNRREKTLMALESLYRQNLPSNVTLKNFIVDDGSSDGTSSAIAKMFRDVQVIDGTRDLYWAGAMRLGWANLSTLSDIDYLFVYNDDVVFFDGAINALLESIQMTEINGVDNIAMAVGCFVDPDTGVKTYGGVERSLNPHPLSLRLARKKDGIYNEVLSGNMNGCLISIKALRSFGFLADYFVHSGADYEFGLRARKNGFRTIEVVKPIGFCKRNQKNGTSSEIGISFTERYNRLFSIKEMPLNVLLPYHHHHAGKAWVFWLISFVLLRPIQLYLRLIINKNESL